MRCRRVVAARDRRHAKRRFGRPTRATQGHAVSFSLPLQGVVCPEGLVGAPDAQAYCLLRNQFSTPHSLASRTPLPLRLRTTCHRDGATSRAVFVSKRPV